MLWGFYCSFEAYVWFKAGRFEFRVPFSIAPILKYFLSRSSSPCFVDSLGRPVSNRKSSLGGRLRDFRRNQTPGFLGGDLKLLGIGLLAYVSWLQQCLAPVAEKQESVGATLAGLHFFRLSVQLFSLNLNRFCWFFFLPASPRVLAVGLAGDPEIPLSKIPFF